MQSAHLTLWTIEAQNMAPGKLLNFRKRRIQDKAILRGEAFTCHEEIAAAWALLLSRQGSDGSDGKPFGSRVRCVGQSAC